MSATRCRRHPAASARIVAAGVSAATAFGLVAAMGVAGPPAAAGQPTVPAPDGAAVTATTAPATTAPVPVVVRRYWLQLPSGAVTPLTDAPPAATAASSLAAPRPSVARAVPAAPAPRPVTRSHGS